MPLPNSTGQDPETQRNLRKHEERLNQIQNVWELTGSRADPEQALKNLIVILAAAGIIKNSTTS